MGVVTFTSASTAVNEDLRQHKTYSCNLRLKHKLSRFRVLGDVSRQTDGTGTFTGGVLSARHQAVDVLQQLRLAGAWISAQQDVDVRPTAVQVHTGTQVRSGTHSFH